MRKILNKYPIVRYVVTSYVKFLFGLLIVFTAVYGMLILSGLYAKLERALDLKYDSPFVLVPLFGFIGLFVVCFFIGFLMYFYKYTRTKSKSVFHKSFSDVLDEKRLTEINIVNKSFYKRLSARSFYKFNRTER